MTDEPKFTPDLAGNSGAHTPGPWKASETYPLGDWCIHAKGIPQQLAYVAASSVVDWPLEANARLIAAAPELADVVKAFIDETVDYMTLNNLGDPEKRHNVKWARKVLSKAGVSQP